MDWKQELLKRLDALAEKLGTTGAYLWAVLYRQARLEGMADTADAIFLGILTYIAYHVAKTCYKKYQEKSEKGHYSSGDAWMAGTIILSVVGTAFSVWSFCVLHSAVLESLNPGYYALEKILQTLGK